MLGNDVVDLEDVDARPETFRRRFEVRVFAEEERQAIAADEHPQARRWAHWGAKEAAYKLARQLDPRFVFSPVRLVARFESTQSSSGGMPRLRERHGHLALDDGRSDDRPSRGVTNVELRSFETSEYVHVVALPVGADWATVAMAVASLAESREDPGLAVRRLALRRIADELGVESGRLSIGRRDRIPTVELDGKTTQLALSLSHHGRFVAFAMAPCGRGRSVVRGEPGAGAGADQGDRSERRDCAGVVTQSTGFVGYPVGGADTEWMAG